MLCGMQMLIVLFAPTFSAELATLTVDLRGNASSIGRQAWGARGDLDLPAWKVDPSATQIRVLADYSMRSAVKLNETLQPLRLTFNLTKHYNSSSIKVGQCLRHLQSCFEIHPGPCA